MGRKALLQILEAMCCSLLDDTVERQYILEIIRDEIVLEEAREAQEAQDKN